MMIMLADLTSLSDNPAELKALVALLGNEVKAQALLIEKLKHQLAVINRQRFGTRSESLDQLNMVFSEDREIAEAAGVPVDTAEAQLRLLPAASIAASLCRSIWCATTRCLRQAHHAGAAAAA